MILDSACFAVSAEQKEEVKFWKEQRDIYWPASTKIYADLLRRAASQVSRDDLDLVAYERTKGVSSDLVDIII
jgi:hypothetical protein